MAGKTVTIYDIAAKAKVSIATVSRVFNDSSRVSEKTRARIFEIARELGYQPHASARNLARKRSSLVAAVIPMMTSFFYLEVLQGVQDHIASSEFDLLVFAAQHLDDIDGVLDHALNKGLSAGVLLFSSPLDSQRLERISQAGPPVVLVDQDHERFNSVSIDNERGGYMAVQYLIEQGYRRIGMITAHAQSVPSIKRMIGYKRALEDHDLLADAQLIISSDDPEFHGYTEEAGYEAMMRILEIDDRPDAVFAVSDIQAIGAMRALRDRGLSIPEDMAVLGFDDIVISRHVGLTTLRQPMYDMGKQATDLLLKQIEKPGRAVSHTVFSPVLVERSSCRKRQTQLASHRS